MVTVNPTHLQPANRQRAGQSRSTVNVGDTERLISAIGGGALAIGGLAFCSNPIGKLVSAAVGGALLYRGLTGHCHLYEAMGVCTAEPRAQNLAVEAGHGVKVEHSILINRPAQDLYQFWRSLEQLPKFMNHLKEVRVSGSKLSHWVARGPLGVSVEWDAEIHNETPGEMIAWRSLPGSQVATAGSVHFTAAPGGHGTEVRVSLKYDPPAGKLGAAVARLFGEAPEQQIRADLSRFKQMMEKGEFATHRGVGPLA